ncbi:hypothetical protein [Rubricoccus marinus]|uniref:Outer membrane protein beta-barrel domain-containing protein n=1 Tax=Rubricoccus marinus TaxID=716817 RepID=A0A259U312_9BACT|nr:hypothetical protein [Rubricoccus marinus]OZC04194.1 hypothetical protein BSZ36_15115 [Rubricoccus marinus]
MRRLGLLLLLLSLSSASGGVLAPEAQVLPTPPPRDGVPPPIDPVDEELDPPRPDPVPRLSSSPRLYGGPALGPGLFGAYAAPQLNVFTQEAALYIDYDPKFTGQGGQLRLGLGVGGSIRLLQVLEIVGDFDADRIDLDAGVRVGPAFDIPFFSPTGEQRTRAFSVLFDPFVRGQVRLGSNRVVFAEVGASEPAIRGGLSLGIGG